LLNWGNQTRGGAGARGRHAQREGTGTKYRVSGQGGEDGGAIGGPKKKKKIGRLGPWQCAGGREAGETGAEKKRGPRFDRQGRGLVAGRVRPPHKTGLPNHLEGRQHHFKGKKKKKKKFWSARGAGGVYRGGQTPSGGNWGQKGRNRPGIGRRVDADLAPTLVQASFANSAGGTPVGTESFGPPKGPFRGRMSVAIQLAGRCANVSSLALFAGPRNPGRAPETVLPCSVAALPCGGGNTHWGPNPKNPPPKKTTVRAEKGPVSEGKGEYAPVLDMMLVFFFFFFVPSGRVSASGDLVRGGKTKAGR